MQEPNQEQEDTTEIAAAFSELSPADRRLAEQQVFCPVSKERLGSMGAPPKVDVAGKPVFICCEGCRALLLADPQKYLDQLAEQLKANPPAMPPEAPQEVER